MWDSLDDICRRERMSVNEMVSFVETKAVSLYGTYPNLTSFVRAFVAEYYRAASTEEGHRLAGHGCGEPVGLAVGEPVSDPPDTQKAANFPVMRSIPA